MNRVLHFALLTAAASASLPAAQAQTSRERETIRQIVVYGSDPCPRSSNNEVVVCARRPESERYRIPPRLREATPTPENESWADKAEALERAGRTGIQSCSPVGPGGSTGCLEQLIRQAREERRQAKREAQQAP